jgi:hypothetical protein
MLQIRVLQRFRSFIDKFQIAAYKQTKQKKRPILDITGFFFRMSTQWRPRCVAPRPSPEYECGKRIPLYIQYGKIHHTIYFFNNTIIVQVRYIIIETNEFSRIGYITGFFFRIRTQVTALVLRTSAQRPFDSGLYLDISRCFKWKESFIFRYFKVFQVSQIFTCGLSDLLWI